MVKLHRIWVAHFYGKDRKHPFNSTKMVASDMDTAEDIAWEWADYKFPNRVKNIVIEKSKGEVVANANH